MARVETTLSVDEHLLRQVRVRAARTGRRDSDVLDEVLREGLGVLERIRAAAGIDEEEIQRRCSPRVVAATTRLRRASSMPLSVWRKRNA